MWAIILMLVGLVFAQHDGILHLLLGQSPAYGEFLSKLEMRGFMRR